MHPTMLSRENELLLLRSRSIEPRDDVARLLHAMYENTSLGMCDEMFKARSILNTNQTPHKTIERERRGIQAT